MAKDKLTEYDATAANNTVVGDVNLAENSALPSDMNNAVREVMSHLKGFASGTDAIDALTVTGAATVNGAFTSPGIDDNADATAITIDSSEIVMTGKTAADFNAAGFQTASNGQTAVTRASATPFFVNRKTDDGDVIDIRKDNTTVGTIGTNGDRLYFTTANKGFYVDESGSEIVPSNGSGSNTNNIMNLGNSSSAFKDLYLGGNLYLGGTGSANALDDYEEGLSTITVTPQTSGSITLYDSANQLGYTKIGRSVHVQAELQVQAVSSPVGTYITLAGLPFNLAALTDLAERFGGGVLFHPGGGSATVEPFFGFSGNEFRILVDASTVTVNTAIDFTFSYLTT